MPEYLFSYGTLQKEFVQLKLFGRRLTGHADRLCGYQLKTIEVEDEVFLSKGEERYQRTLVPTSIKDDAVDGTVLELTYEELLKADSYEPENYKRKRITLASGKQAWIYLVAEA
jgi:gamma-glutamylcyclotransferase (GGCT)/AIG2-like uncharacterized protein YtfP